MQKYQTIVLLILLTVPCLAHEELDLFKEYTEHVIDPCYRHGAILSGFDKVVGLELAVAAMKAQDEADNKIAAEMLRQSMDRASREERLMGYRKLRHICKCQIAEKAKLANQGKIETGPSISESDVDCMMQGFGLTAP